MASSCYGNHLLIRSRNNGLPFRVDDGDLNIDHRLAPRPGTGGVRKVHQRCPQPLPFR